MNIECERCDGKGKKVLQFIVKKGGGAIYEPKSKDIKTNGDEFSTVLEIDFNLDEKNKISKELVE